MYSNNINKRKTKIVEILLEFGIIDQKLLRKAIKKQKEDGKNLLTILENIGAFDEDVFLNFLSRQFGVPSANLFNMNIEKELLQLLPFEKVKQLNILPLYAEGNNIIAAMTNPFDYEAIKTAESMMNYHINPFVVPVAQMEAILHYFMEEGYGTDNFYGEKVRQQVVIKEFVSLNIFFLLKYMLEQKGTYLHLSTGAPPAIRIDDELHRLAAANISQEQMNEFIDDLLSKDLKSEFYKKSEVDFSFSFSEIGRFRINIYKQRNSITISAKHVKEEIPTLKSLGLPEWLSAFALKEQGLILITAPAGHGKSSTLASLLDVINTHRKCNIITLENPIDYVHKHKMSNLNQREVGVDTDSYHEGLKYILRQDPDVIAISELMEPEDISTALTAAETGHLVISTLHSPSTTSAVDWLIDLFPINQQRHIRVKLADCLQIVFSQLLIPKKNGKGRVLAYESLINSPKTKNILREERAETLRIKNENFSEELKRIDLSLAYLCNRGEINLETGLQYAENPNDFLQHMNSISLSSSKDKK